MDRAGDFMVDSVAANGRIAGRLKGAPGPACRDHGPQKSEDVLASPPCSVDPDCVIRAAS
jgi:hypothetical protein